MSNTRYRGPESGIIGLVGGSKRQVSGRFGALGEREPRGGLSAQTLAGFKRSKINSVILKNRTQDEVVELTRFAGTLGMDISFIEEMPLGVIGEHDRAEAYFL